MIKNKRMNPYQDAIKQMDKYWKLNFIINKWPWICETIFGKLDEDIELFQKYLHV